ncbi:MAG: hypothetical protein KC800_00285 [Candidatus Eremiobacteraeota bacterium]|nr:hypothetical protein [Candidatus Eremiobacteraeota bacterium]
MRSKADPRPQTEEFVPAEGRDELGDVGARVEAGTEIARSRARRCPSGRAVLWIRDSLKGWS